MSQTFLKQFKPYRFSCLYSFMAKCDHQWPGIKSPFFISLFETSFDVPVAQKHRMTLHDQAQSLGHPGP